jgi:hypothetical protein
MSPSPPHQGMHAAQVINSSYPEEIVRYYSPAYPQMLLQRLDALAGSAPAPKAMPPPAAMPAAPLPAH